MIYWLVIHSGKLCMLHGMRCSKMCACFHNRKRHWGTETREQYPLYILHVMVYSGCWIQQMRHKKTHIPQSRSPEMPHTLTSPTRDGPWTQRKQWNLEKCGEDQRHFFSLLASWGAGKQGNKRDLAMLAYLDLDARRFCFLNQGCMQNSVACISWADLRKRKVACLPLTMGWMD